MNIIDRYLDIVRLTVLDLIYREGTIQNNTFNENEREEGRAWPLRAFTMIGNIRINNIKNLTTDIIANNIPGDFVETGVWRGGACIFMTAVLEAHADTTRSVWVCDSFEGLPTPNVKDYPQDTGDNHHTHQQLAVDIDTVKENFSRFNLLTDRVKFLKGWFSDTIPSAPIETISLLRLDGDMYESTIVVLENLYPKISTGGYVIIDDYGLPKCALAVSDFRKKYNINSELITIDHASVYWKKV
jgi:O-methyltransferase